MAHGLAADADALKFIGADFRNVDVQARALRQSVVEDGLGHRLGHADGGGEVGVPPLVEQGEPDGGDAAHGAFHGGGHGARVDHVDGGVAAVVDSAHEQVGQVVLTKDLGHGELDAIHGGSRARAGFADAAAEFERVEPEDAAERDGVAHAALGAVRRDDIHVAEFGHRLGEALDALGRDAVVIGDDNAGALARGVGSGHPFCGVRAKASWNQFQYLAVDDTDARSSGLWAPRMVGPKLTMSSPG